MARRRDSKGRFVKRSKRKPRTKTKTKTVIKYKTRRPRRRANVKISRRKTKTTGFKRLKKDLAYPVLANAGVALIEHMDIGAINKLMGYAPFKQIGFPATVALALYAAAEIIPMNKGTRDKLYQLAVGPAAVGLYQMSHYAMIKMKTADWFDDDDKKKDEKTEGLIGELAALRDLPSDLEEWTQPVED
jgi:hypothetical protein